MFRWSRPRAPRVFLLLLLALAVLAPARAQTRHWKVLVVESYHEGFAWSEAQTRGFLETLRAGLGAYSLDLSIFHLDDRRHPERRAAADDDLDELYARADLDLIYASDNPAFDLMARRPWRLARAIPLVFSGVNDYHPDGHEASLVMTGIGENFQTGRIDTLRIALSLLPATRRVVCLLDATPTSAAIRREFEEVRPQFPGLDFEFPVIEDLAAQLDLARGLGPGDILLPIGTHRDGSGSLLSYEEAMEDLAAASPVPAFGFIENRIGHGIVGGRILTGRDHGAKAGALALAVLSGKPLADLPPVTDNPGRLIVDHRQLARFGLSEAALPLGAEVINLPEARLLHLLPLVGGGILAVSVLSALLVLSVLSRNRLAQAQASLGSSERLLDSYFENSPNAIIIVDDEGRYRKANRAAESITGFSRTELETRTIGDLVHPDSLELGRTHFSRLLDEGRSTGEYRFRNASGESFWMRIKAVRLGPDQNLAICEDVTRQVEGEARIRASLAEKETLLRELYHRTKNNMYLIIALLGLAEDGLAAEADRRIFEDISGRIASMALVHEKLYRSADLSHIRFDAYLRELFDLVGSAVPASKAALDLALEAVELPVDQALPLGLVVYELLLNAYRHAVPAGAGRISLDLRREADGALSLTVADDGPGFPEGFDPAKAESMGLQLVNSIVVHQLGGSVAWGRGRDSPRGMSCALRIPAKVEEAGT